MQNLQGMDNIPNIDLNRCRDQGDWRGREHEEVHAEEDHVEEEEHGREDCDVEGHDREGHEEEDIPTSHGDLDILPARC